MMSSTHIRLYAAGAAATTPMVVPPRAFEGVLRGDVVLGSGVSQRTRWTKRSASNPVLACFTQDHRSSIDNGGGLRTRVEVTHRQ